MRAGYEKMGHFRCADRGAPQLCRPDRLDVFSSVPLMFRPLHIPKCLQRAATYLGEEQTHCLALSGSLSQSEALSPAPLLEGASLSFHGFILHNISVCGQGVEGLTHPTIGREMVKLKLIV